VRPRRPLLLLLAAALAAPLLVAATGAGEPPAADAGADAGADAEAGVDAGPPLPALDAEPFPDKRSGMPKEDEWRDATEVTLHRYSHAMQGSLSRDPSSGAPCIDGIGCAPPIFPAHEAEKAACHARRLREWLRVDCATKGGVLLLGGTADGVWLKAGSATFPVRRGDRREIEFLDVETTFSGYRAMEEHHRAAFRFTLSEAWAPGDERPWVAAD
jgi:hypothetical protein